MSDDARDRTGYRSYGGWPSVIDAASIAAGVVSLVEPKARAGTVYWLETRPEESGRSTLMCRGTAGEVRELTPAPCDVRSRIHEYGGGAYVPTDDGVVFVDGPEQRLCRTTDAGIQRLTETDPAARYGDFCIDAGDCRLFMVVEHHERGEVRNFLAVLDLENPADGIRPLHQGRDFYASPRLSPDGRQLAFVTWDHPNMPWDGTELRVLELDASGAPGAETLIAGGAAESVVQPVWMPDGSLLFASDRNGFWNLHRFDAGGSWCVLEDAAEYAGPLWALAQSWFVPVGDRHVAAVRREGQHSELVLVDAVHGFATPLATPWQEFRWLTCDGRELLFAGCRDDQPPALVRLPLDGRDPETVTQAAMPPIGADWIARPDPLVFPTRDGACAHAYYYPPTNPRLRPDPDERPPLLVLTHGGPTGRTSACLDPRIQFFTSRGFAVVDVDYRGSSGYGRAYRKALDGRWGILEVSDCEDAVAHLVAANRADPRRVAIRGGSAGGFTTLAALTTSRVFAAGASYYGIGDLRALAAETHKFESRYLHTLLGDDQALDDRSPIRHVDNLSCPVIFFQGSDDRVVPPGQARAMVEALDAKGLPVAYLEFDGEGHGFRRAENIQRSLSCEYAFYCRVFGIEPDDPAPELRTELEIRNL